MARGVPKSGSKSIALACKNLPKKPRKEPFGRPIKYTAEWLKEEAQALIEWIEKDEGIYLGDFAYERGYARTMLPDFASTSKDFFDALELARNWQERKLLTNGLLKNFDATQVRYTMARLCGDIWKNSYDREESDKDITLNINVNRIQD